MSHPSSEKKTSPTTTEADTEKPRNWKTVKVGHNNPHSYAEYVRDKIKSDHNGE